MAVTDEAISKIREMITSGELAPGDRLPPEKELSERLGLSRSSLREAVKALEVIRILDVRRGDGTYVTSLEPRLLLEALSFVVDLHSDRSVLEIFAVRRILEPAATDLATRAATDEEVDRLAAILDLVDPGGSIEGLVDHDLAFHQAIADISGNEYLSRLLESMSGGTVRARVWRGITQHGASERTIAEQASILAAMRSRDAQLASALTCAHVAGIEQWLRSDMESRS
ncbi:FadR/GntR family transcriptional regulator [Microbacterium rhizosphaerae]|uniref:FadR/GntR family transcriptional regulator n=1 Tax=Microbacterium rhizosphaerae TaxID=1678237 RepID=A0ABZ0SMR0_9MICO|nr:FadR/GntR family transcriptional regulator [Microbacterium rhizosphaerae]WPR89118.1 FadR/GntR family transcriptional regulator [Microbacterium rhizosphaerae]